MSNSVVTRVQWAWRSLLIRSGIPQRRDRGVFRRSFRRVEQADAGHVLLVAPGAGNVGDQALFEAFAEGAAGRITVITRRPDDVVVPAAHAARVVVVPLPQLVYGLGKPHRAEVAKFAGILSRAVSFSVIGADIMDGRYVLRASVARSVLAGAAAEAGLPTRIIGFSWNSSTRPAARKALVAASRRGVVPLFRDPVSLRRAQADGVANAELVADIVFAAKSVDTSWGTRFKKKQPLAIVNVSGLIAKDADQTQEYVDIIEHLLGEGRDVLLLPHVSVSSADDVGACRAVFERVGADRISMADALPTPPQVRGLSAVADIVVTGRMHLAVMSLWNETPAITLATQGKVEGLMELVGAPELCVAPVKGFGKEVIARLGSILPADSDTRRTISESLPRVKALAAKNVSGLDDSGDESGDALAPTAQGLPSL